MAAPAWQNALPSTDDALSTFPDCSDDDQFELIESRIVGASSATAAFHERPEIVNVALDRCDVTGFGATAGRADRVQITDSRLRAFTWANGMVQDVELSGVAGAEVTFRFSTLRRVTFRDCELPGLDFTEVTFDDVRLERCNLAGAQFDKARVKALRIEGCDLTGCSGAGALGGASVHPDDLIALAPSMAGALGIKVEES